MAARMRPRTTNCGDLVLLWRLAAIYDHQRPKNADGPENGTMLPAAGFRGTTARDEPWRRVPSRPYFVRLTQVLPKGTTKPGESKDVVDSVSNELELDRVIWTAGRNDDDTTGCGPGLENADPRSAGR